MYILQPAREIPCTEAFDLCVLGGSCTGVFAAVRAAQMGLRVALVERQNAFGGAAASGLVHIWHSLHDTEGKRQVIGGLTAQTIERLGLRAAVSCDPFNVSSAYKMNTEELKIELDILVREHGVVPFLHTTFTDVVHEGGAVRAVIVENKDGAAAIRARFFIDATGDGDLCRRLDIPSYTLGGMQPPTMCAKILGADPTLVEALIRDHGEEFGLERDHGWRNTIPNAPGVLMQAETHVFRVNCAHAGDLTFSEMEGRKQVRAVTDLLRKYMPGGEKITILSLPSYIGIRDTYHIKSLHRVKTDDLLHGVAYEDAIGNGTYRVDVHHDDGTGMTFKYLDGKMEYFDRTGGTITRSLWREQTDQSPTYYQIPYGALVPDAPFSNVLFAGRMIDAEKEAFSALRVMVNTNQMGEAAGVAAAIAVQSQCAARDVSPGRLRGKLSALGAIII